MITIVIGDITNSVQEHVQLLTESNKQLTPGMYYASLADFSSYRSFVDILDQADHIVYAPPVCWSDQNKQGISYMKIWTEHCLFYFNDKKRVTGASFAIPVNDQQILKLADIRKSNDQQLWIAGGSNGVGLGVTSDQRFGQLIADYFKLPVSFLTEVGSSMEWAADQILRADIRSSDIIIWATVPVSRFPFYCNQSVVHVNVDHYEKNPKFNNQVDIDQLGNSNTLLYRPITSVERVQNICNKLNIKLVIAGISKHSEYTSHLLKFKNYIHLAGRFGLDTNDEYLDFGDDDFHQGPKMHQWYADQIIAKLIAND